ncbi:ABC transporter ATP-binding protein [Methylobacterium organophilum]|uniref:Vitamin B12 import ATP-binding protein BtuD n=1 Tax=Methylobacterium organophilum TaxID=410 RepID=A0ABQ4T6N3_METOR|nr:ABC transporter ATP-binding protein [Methylobacterium organophilum]UMY16605.1 ABC transporter ATP-binding protein [Methylobacterium organophilum]GJE27345.1 Vitamin B12 import ATP-binding protein BtuD [Methylobacterium organophilum]
MSQSGSPLVVVASASLAYRGRPALARVDLTLRAGEILALLGPNGAGKTSLMRLVAGRLAPAAGSVRVAGGDPFRAGAVRRLIGWVPQEIALYPRLTVAENLDVFAELAGLSAGTRRAAVARALDQGALGPVARRIVGTLSGGYQRRANIAASLVARPRLILLDEPTQGVDLEARAAIHALLAGLRAEGAGLLVSTHDFAEAERLADRVAVLGEGRLLREGPLPALLDPLRRDAPEQEVLLEDAPAAAARAALAAAGFTPAGATVWRGRTENGLDGAALLAHLRALGVPVAEIRLRRPGLESLYRAVLAGAPPAPAPALSLAETGR